MDGHVRVVTPAAELGEDSTVLVVGASLAGWRAVQTLRAEGFEGTISLIGEEPHLPYDRPPLSKQVLAGTWPPEKAVLADKRRSSELLVHEVLGRRAVRIDTAGPAIELDDGTVLAGDGVVITTGAAPRRLPGTEGLGQRDGLFTLRTLDDSVALRAAVTATEAARVVVIGAGFIGAEVASTCRGARLPRHRPRGSRHPAATGARADAGRALCGAAAVPRGRPAPGGVGHGGPHRGRGRRRR